MSPWGGVKGRGVGAKGAASERMEKGRKSARKTAKRKRNGEDLGEDDNEILKNTKFRSVSFDISISSKPIPPVSEWQFLL